MSLDFLSAIAPHYNWQLSLIALVAIYAFTFAARQALNVAPTFRNAAALNVSVYKEKMEIPRYAANQRLNRGWGLFFTAIIFLAIMPFCVTIEAQPWWRIPRDIVIVLLVYDFFYYLAHRFLFHDNGFMGGPLIWVHAVHHQQRDPCRGDSSYIHPLEVAMGLGIYVLTIFALSRFLGAFHLVTIMLTWFAFSEINQHNHDRWTVDRFPFRYLNYMSVMHHHHHAKFTGGNYATISLLYDWMFGTMDHGEGWGRNKQASNPQGQAARD